MHLKLLLETALSEAMVTSLHQRQKKLCINLVSGEKVHFFLQAYHVQRKLTGGESEAET